MWGARSRLIVDVRTAAERFRSSLFFFPVMFVIVAVALAGVMLWVDGRIDDTDLPAWLRTTESNAQVVLGTVAGATITVSGIAFSLTLVSVQLASSQLSPRVMRHFLRDRFQQSVMGLTVGTFAYCLIVLRATTVAVAGDRPVIPHLAVGAAVVLGVATVIGILAFIDHGARAVQAGRLIGRISDETRAVHAELVRRGVAAVEGDASLPAEPGFTVTAPEDGWVQQVSEDALFASIGDGVVVRLDVHVGSYVTPDGAVATVWPEPADAAATADRVLNAVAIGNERTMQEDVEFGIRQMVDVGLRALSPAVNDPSTAYEAIVHLAGVVGDILCHDLPPRAVRGPGDRRIVRPFELSHEALLGRAFDQLRIAAADQPHVCVALAKALGRIHDRVLVCAPERAHLVRAEARLVLETAAAASPLPRDLTLVRQGAAFAIRGSSPPG